MDDYVILTDRPTIFGMVWQSITSVGWYILGVIVALFFASPYLSDKYNDWKQKKDEAEYAKKYHKDPDLFVEQTRAIEEARLRMQEKYNEAVRIAQEKEEEKKRQKQQELQNLLKDGHKLGTKDDASSSTLLHGEYNPLMGDSSRGYRPPKRSCCGKKCG